MVSPLVLFPAGSFNTAPIDYEVVGSFGQTTVDVVPVTDRARALAGFEGVRNSDLEPLARKLHDRGFRVAGFQF